MRFGTRLNPRVEERLRGVSGGSGDELVGRLTEGSIRTEGDCLEADAELLVLSRVHGALNPNGCFSNFSTGSQISVCQRSLGFLTTP